MIYLDNAATTLHKPPQVEQAILEALHTAGNPGRGAHEPTLHAARIVLDTRLALAELFHAPDPSCIVFAANATMALNTLRQAGDWGLNETDFQIVANAQPLAEGRWSALQTADAEIEISSLVLKYALDWLSIMFSWSK